MGEYLSPVDESLNKGLVSGLIDQLQYGLGYSSYRKKEQMRNDDQLVRNRACELIIESKNALRARATAWRQVNLACTRENPFPSPDKLVIARAMDDVIQQVSALETSVRNAALPAIANKGRSMLSEENCLPQLQMLDTELLHRVIALLELAKGAGEALAQESQFQTALEAVRSSILKRREVFSGFFQLNVKE